MKSMETGRQDGGSDKNHALFSVGETGNISRKFLTIILKIFDKNFERLQQWIAFLDSDDLWLPNKLEKQINFMKNNGYKFSYTNYEEIDMASNKTGVRITGPKKITKMGMYNYCWPGCLTVMYDANEIGLIQIEDIKKNNDYAMWLKVCQKADCYLLDEVLAQYRKGRVGSVSTHSIRTMIGWHYMLYHEAEKMGKLESLFNTGRNLLFGYYKKRKYVKKFD